MQISTLGYIHATAGVIALALGLIVLLSAKGTGPHRAVGAIYVVAMIVVDIGSFWLVGLLGHWGPIHALSALSLLTLSAGILAVWMRWERWMITHYRCMAWSYVGLVAAGTDALVNRFPLAQTYVTGLFHGLATPLTITLVVSLAGALLIPRLEKRVLAHLTAV